MIYHKVFNIWVSKDGFIKRPRLDEINYGKDNGKGYLYVNVKCPSGRRLKNNKPRWTKKYIHRLVYETFVGPLGIMDVHHLNGNPKDNRLDNLQLLTRGDNTEEAFVRRNRNRLFALTDEVLAEEDLHL